MDNFKTIFEFQSLRLKSLRSIIKKTGLDLIAAKYLMTTKLLSEYPNRSFAPHSSKKILRTLNYDQLQEHTQSADHDAMSEYAIQQYCSKGYRFYPHGVGLKRVPNALADFLVEKDGEVIIGEALTKKSLQQVGNLENKLQFTKFVKMCLVISQSAIEFPYITEKLQSIATANDIFVYIENGLGDRENHLVEFSAYLFFLRSSKNLPKLSAIIERKASIMKMLLQFDDSVPKTMKEVELAETWRMAFLHHLMSQRNSFSIPTRQKNSVNEYLINFEQANFASPRFTNRDLLTIRIVNDGVEVSLRSKWGRDVFKDHFVPLLKGKGIDREIRKFLSLASTNA